MFSFFKSSQKFKTAIAEIWALVASDIEKEGLLAALRIDDVKVNDDGQAIVALLALNFDKPEALESFRSSVQNKIAGLKNISKVLVVMTADQKPPAPVAKPVAANPLEGVEVIAVASGKGGVGKSTVAVNLAVALSQLGRKVGILDADIYGPSLPRLFGIADKKAEQGPDGRLLPIEIYGIKAMSMGFMVDEATPMIWRGPMVQSALIQMIRDVAWDGIDTLIIDMPPGTGDIHLTLAQRVPLAGGVVVSTPQDIALIDARKGLEMFKKMAVPILGIVENMSYYTCPNCGTRADIFGHGGAHDEAIKIGVPFLGEIPLHISIRETSDAGQPVTLSAIKSDEAKSFVIIAENVLGGLQQTRRPPPHIIMED